MKGAKLNATSLRASLIFLLVLICVLIAGGFYFAQDWLSKYASSINSATQASTNTEISPSELNKIQSELFKQKTTIDKAANITVSKRDYNSKIQQDINRYASENGISVTEYGPASTPAITNTTPLTGGAQASYVSITIKNPVSYVNLIKFIKGLETNLPKMRLVGISLDRVETPNGSVNVDPITIEVYLR